MGTICGLYIAVLYFYYVAVLLLRNYEKAVYKCLHERGKSFLDAQVPLLNSPLPPLPHSSFTQETQFLSNMAHTYTSTPNQNL